FVRNADAGCNILHSALIEADHNKAVGRCGFGVVGHHLEPRLIQPHVARILKIEAVADVARIHMDRPRLEQDGGPAVIASKGHAVRVAAVQEGAALHDGASRQPKAHLPGPASSNPRSESYTTSAIRRCVDNAPKTGKAVGTTAP